MSRGISTAVDAVVFLSLLSAAVLVVSVPAPEPTRLPADETATVLTTSTATVSYDGPGGTRQSTGSYTGLLARAAVADAGLGEETPPVTSRYRAAVVAAVDDAIGARTHVSARWSPYPDAPVAGQVSLGAEPPAEADVHAATVRIPVPVPRAETADDRTVRDVGESAARAIVRGAAPAEPTTLPRDRAVRGSVSERLRRLGGVGQPVESEVSKATTKAYEKLAVRVTADLRSRYDSTAEAKRALDLQTATVTVRRWDG